MIDLLPLTLLPRSGLFIIRAGHPVFHDRNDLPVGRSVDETLRGEGDQYTDKHGEVCPAADPGA